MNKKSKVKPEELEGRFLKIMIEYGCRPQDLEEISKYQKKLLLLKKTRK